MKYTELGCNLLGCDGVDHGFVTYILGHLQISWTILKMEAASSFETSEILPINTASYPRTHQQCYENQVQHYTELMWKIMGLTVHCHRLFM